MWTNLFRPVQKMIVAIAIVIPGTPNAQCGPQYFNIPRRHERGEERTRS